MADDDELRARVQVVEDELARLRDQVAVVAADAAARTLAAGADRDAAEVRAELRGHTRTLNALRDTQVEHGHAIVELRAEMRDGFATLATGMEHITTLLDRVIERGE